ncbi:zinc finger protein 395b isoform X1 [Anarrhichthys ocellatus]|uniref:zinc finger protein 395b isoform X1 n=1 Tax=Anarrhichthys ocellatus TaxID=433405 RepID=UPI0012ECC0FE|nr:zinc finger protein 395-like isoform X1 [Anarrhichthys ocellatus]XP_031733176.1 zinc finger protein 395-like isoform X1 [Anarrhichthys ocellatus]
MGPEDRAGAGPGGTAVSPEGTQARASVTTRGGGPDTQRTLVDTQWCAQVEKAFAESRHRKNTTSVQLPQREAERGWSNRAASSQAAAPTMHLSNGPASREAPYCFRSPGSVEMDEIMAAMVLTSLSCSPVVQGPPQTDPGPGLSHLIPTHSLASVQLFTLSNKASVTDDFINAGSSSSADMECGGGELSDSGSSGYWSWDHGNVSPAPSPSVTEMDSSPDEGLQMELEQGEELNAKKPKSSFRGVYRCLWPSCGKVLTSSVGMKRHIRVLHLGSGSDQSQREEDFYYTKISCETVDASSTPAPALAPSPAPAPVPGPAPSQQALGQSSSSHLSWASCSSPPPSGLQIPPAHRPRSNSSSGAGPSRPSPLSQSAPSSFWQIHSEHLYQACSPIQVSGTPRSPGCQGWTPSTSVTGHSNTPVVKPRCRSVSVGEQWLQQNRLQPISVSPSRTHCSFRKGRGEAKKCRKVYGVERKDQWCTACRWKKACQRFLD